jgi:cytidylate kinase
VRASHFENALPSPRNLGEAKHLLANQSDIHYWLGCALDWRAKKIRARNTGSPPQISKAIFRR